jgi:nitroimidazol reductase NimA-like FMN-containing flavoprotein (pyridoxamine 5'-phosphate oxidase superfamily)
MTEAETQRTPRARIRRLPANARYDWASVRRVLDRGHVAHVAFATDGQPFCIPTLYTRADERVLIHGSTASRMMRALASGVPACMTVTVMDGWVLARSAFETGANYDSVVLFGHFRPVEGREEKLGALEEFIERVLPGRWSEIRHPSSQELKGTAILAFEIDEASVKTKTGGPDDDDTPDAELDTWAGEVPIVSHYGEPEPAPGLRPGIPVSPSVERLVASPPWGS